MKIFLAGGTGFLGLYISRFLSEQGHKITLLSRKPFNPQTFCPDLKIVVGNPVKEGLWQDEIAGNKAVINMTGASIFQLWTKRTKKEIFESRILSTLNIINAMKRSKKEKMVLFNASGAGYYGPCGESPIDERYRPGDTFLARVALEWERTALKAEDAGIRVILCRLGTVLGKGGGAFPKLFNMTKLHSSAPWGNGEQWFSWIHEKDMARAFSFLLDHEGIKGPVNFTSPKPVKNSKMAALLNDILNKKPFFSKIPSWFLKNTLGEFSSVFLTGQKVLPEVLLKNGFVFQFQNFSDAVVDLIKCKKK
ncbi:MAG TPA: TIGR01777 family protein [Actinobacteria bacterium]|nr:TIGR01777 family protein [Actinomycetota bacterium]